MKSQAFIMLILAGAAAAAAAATGTITGTVDKASAVTRVIAVNREAWVAYTGRCDAATGAFAIEGLPLETNYDCLFDYDGTRLEGVNLKVPPPDDPDNVLTTNDIAEIRAKVLNMNKFDDIVEVMTITGTGERTAILLNKVRTTPFWNSKPGEVIWRVDLWHYQHPEDFWLKVQDELFLIFYRERMPSIEDYKKKAILFDANLGGLRPTVETPVVNLGRLALPAIAPGIRLRAAGDKATEAKQP